MNPLGELGKLLIFMGILLLILGAFLSFGSKIPFIGRLPGDFSYHKGNFHFYFPLGTSILLSIVLTLLLWIMRK